jgi:predicted aldo/keto reductase-like oxidoreductase
MGPEPTRRDVLVRAALLGGAASASLVAGAVARPAHGDGPATLPRRPFGRTGREVTVLGLGCFPVGGIPDDDAAIAVVRRAYEGGCRYFDTAPTYADGRSETRVGRALAGLPRGDLFLATKTFKPRTALHARRDLESSLKRLRTEYVDLLQIHAVADADDLQQILAEDGPLAAALKAKEQGLVRHVGVTGHADPTVMAKALAAHDFDSILFPLNCVDPHHLSFVQGTLPAAVKKGLARLAMKVFASGGLVQKGIDAERCLRYAFGLDVSAAVVGCSTVAEVDLALRVARDARPLAPDELQELLRSTQPLRGKSLEWYKRA